MPRPLSTPADPVVLVTAADENYARGAAATVRSAIASLPREWPLWVYVLDGGITSASRWKLWLSWRRRGVQVRWLKPNLADLGDLEVSGHVTVSTYLRILLADLLPAQVEKAIYLDADTIVERDLRELWQIELGDAPIAATQDVFHPVLDPRLVFDRPLHCESLGIDPLPIPNYRQLGLSGTSPYFNAGVMLVNVAQWRRERFAARAFACLREHAGQIRYWDQYALNSLFSGRWKVVDSRWNQNTQVFRLPGAEFSHYSPEELERVSVDPWIIHFDYKPKPWEETCEHPSKDKFFRHLDRTWWHGWRPGPPWRERAAARYQELRRSYRKWRQTRIGPIVRPIKAFLRGRRNAA